MKTTFTQAQQNLLYKSFFIAIIILTNNSANATCLNLTIDAGGTLSIGNFTLTIAAGGTLTNNGSVSGTGGASAAVTFSGAGSIINNSPFSLTSGPILNVSGGDVTVTGSSLFNFTTVNIASGFTLTNTVQISGLTVKTDI